MDINRDISSTVILILLLVVIAGLVFYLFFYSGSQPISPPSIEPVDQNVNLFLPPTLDTRFKGKDVYVIDPQAKVRSEPRPDATVVAEKKRGERLTVIGANDRWFEVEFEDKTGWILREQVIDRLPSSRKAEKPARSPDTEVQENIQTLDQLRADTDNITAFINQRAMELFGQEMVSGFEIRDGGKRLTMYVTKVWYILPPFQKQVMLNLVAMRYGNQTCIHGVRTECSSNDFPTINFLNPDNKEIARVGANQPMQIFE